MFTDVYSTTPCKAYRDVIAKIKKEIKLSVELDEDNSFRIEKFGVGKKIMALTGPDRDIPSFAHPIIMPGRETGWFEDTVVFDARGFVTVGRDESLTIRQHQEFELHLLRAELTRYVACRHYDDLAAVGSFPLQVFVEWLSQLITRRLAIDPEAQQRTSAIIAIYYISLFKDPSDLVDQSDILIAKQAQVINRLFRIDSELVVGLLKSLPPMTDVSDLVQTLKDHAGSERFENFNIGLLYTIVGGSWFGAQAKEIMAVSLEHPPTWISIIASALTSQTWRNTAIGEHVKRLNRNNVGNDYLRGLYRLPDLKNA